MPAPGLTPTVQPPPDEPLLEAVVWQSTQGFWVVTMPPSGPGPVCGQVLETQVPGWSALGPALLHAVPAPAVHPSGGATSAKGAPRSRR